MSISIEVINNIIPLLSTIEEGLNHIKKQLAELRYEEAFTLLQDSIMGIITIEAALKPMEQDIEALEKPEIIQAKQKLTLYMDEVITLYENKRYEELGKKVQSLLDTFIIWKEALEIAIIPIVVS